MMDSDDGRRERRAAVLRAMQKLRDEFPLQNVIEGLDSALRAVYVKTLSHWILQGIPPPRNFSSEAEIQALCALGALTIDECGIGCYPFSARDTGIHAHFARHGVYAMCAIDALAIPRLVQHAAHVTAQCAMCRCHLACTVAANGSVDGGNMEGVRVVWGISRCAAEGTCCGIPCPGIQFACRHCAAPPGTTGFSLPEAAAVGNSFFAFQRSLLTHHEQS